MIFQQQRKESSEENAALLDAAVDGEWLRWAATELHYSVNGIVELLSHAL